MNILHKYTREILLKNKLRTIVTIIGIILSVAMLTAVTTSITSAQNFMVELELEESGAWEGTLYSLDEADAAAIKKDEAVAGYTVLQNIGYAQSGSHNEYKPYVYVAGISKDFTDYVAVHMVSGRMPQNSNELVIPQHLSDNGGIEWKVGDTVTLDVGQRYWRDERLTQQQSFYMEDEMSEGEDLRDTQQKTYTIVGIYERFNLTTEPYSAPGYTALTVAVDNPEYEDLYLKFKETGKFYDTWERICQEYDTEGRVHDNLLRCQGIGNDDSILAMLWGLGAVLMVIIMFGSISLIYNAFSISVSERTKQFGILKSIGATKKQIRHTVIYEALVLGAIGIPLGLIAGVAGIGVTFKLLEGTMSKVMSEDVVFGLSVAPVAIIVAAAVGLVTVLISAWIPARKAMKLTAMEAIRQSADIKVTGSNVKTSKLTYKIFGFEGMIASKNFKRNKKKYRVTVMSLFVSIVLFISASSLSAYLTKSMTTSLSQANYDIEYMLYNTNEAEAADTAQKLSKIAAVEEYAYTMQSINGTPLYTDVSNVTDDYLSIYEPQRLESGELAAQVFASIEFVNDDYYRSYLEDEGVDVEKYMDAENPLAYVYDFERNYVQTGDGSYRLEFYSQLREAKYPMECTLEPGISVTLGGFAKNAPLFETNSSVIMYPLSAMKNILGEGNEIMLVICIKSSDHAKTYEELQRMEKEGSIPDGYAYDIMAEEESARALLMIINVFSYGFIVLISMIALANVFNTISTNIMLRRREFAMLKSVGMTKKGFYRIMNFECLMYGSKALLLGLPVSVAVSYVLYLIVRESVEVAFFLPWYSIAIAVGSVFCVVFATMLYSMNKLHKENTVDELKRENI